MLARTEFIFQALHEGGTAISFHRHRCYEIVYYREGRGTTTIGRTSFAYEPRTYALIRPDTDHDENRRERTDVLCVGFQIADSRLLPPRSGVFADDGNGSVEARLLAMKAEMSSKPLHYERKIDLGVSDFLIDHLRLNETDQAAFPSEHLVFARNYIDEHCNESIDLARLADMSGYSYHRFRHLFKEKFGRSPMHYVLDRRIERARGLLLRTSHPVSVIAAMCGFSTTAQFCTLFKRECGSTPVRFRNDSR